MHRDHIFPKWKGGSDEPWNKQLLCANCHEDKTREDLRGQNGLEGRKLSPETKEAIRRAMNAFYSKFPVIDGKRLSADHRAKISAGVKLQRQNRQNPVV